MPSCPARHGRRASPPAVAWVGVILPGITGLQRRAPPSLGVLGEIELFRPRPSWPERAWEKNVPKEDPSTGKRRREQQGGQVSRRSQADGHGF